MVNKPAIIRKLPKHRIKTIFNEERKAGTAESNSVESCIFCCIVITRAWYPAHRLKKSASEPLAFNVSMSWSPDIEPPISLPSSLWSVCFITSLLWDTNMRAARFKTTIKTLTLARITS